jgi:hypothetical protein
MYQGASRAKCNAVGPRLDRGVRPRRAVALVAALLRQLRTQNLHSSAIHEDKLNRSLNGG